MPNLVAKVPLLIARSGRLEAKLVSETVVACGWAAAVVKVNVSFGPEQ